MIVIQQCIIYATRSKGWLCTHSTHMIHRRDTSLITHKGNIRLPKMFPLRAQSLEGTDGPGGMALVLADIGTGWT